jgi:golgi-specific brefeldin A-resistance guanine nucleotide exchange factor 1
MQGDLCKHLLHSSQTEDLTILSLTLRVVFNLFNSIKEHLKVQLEVFLTSIHLRILESSAASHAPEQRELVLESLLEFCREPALMLDLYINYDCDVQCTNLFETVCNALARQALPAAPHTHPNALNRLALEGVLAVIESMARRCSATAVVTAGSETVTSETATGVTADNRYRRGASYESSLAFDESTATATAGGSSDRGLLLPVRSSATSSGSMHHNDGNTNNNNGGNSSESDSEFDTTAGPQQVREIFLLQ